ncbi:redoxin domain-containing protein [Halorubrum rubrum]|uniref:Redoxin domain-containing protein n=2 Tax=Halorubrum rubrum TaxID=1126240 RepID=A0ABD5R028_9EURY
MCTLRDSETLSLPENAVVLGISTDSVYSHRAVAEKHRIDFPIRSDGNDRVADAYGARADEMDDHRGVARSPATSTEE